MPFDGLISERQQYLLERLDAVSELLSSEQKWCKRRLRQPDGSRCLRGALIDARVAWLLHRPIIMAAREVTRTHYFCIQTFNDADDTDYALVLKVLAHVRVTLSTGIPQRTLLQDIVYILHRRFDGTRTRWTTLPGRFWSSASYERA